MTTHRTSLLIVAFALLGGCADTAVQRADTAVDAQLEQAAARLEQRIAQLEDLEAIKRLQRAWGYYIDEAQWDRAAALFATDGSIELGLDGVYQGRERVRQYLYALGGGRAGLEAGQLNEHLQLMPVVTLGADGRTAQGTWRDLMMVGRLGRDAFWGEGPQINEYVKENGVWKIRRLHWFQTVYVPYEGGWAKTADVNQGRFVRTLTPDAPPTVRYESWPGVVVPPFPFRQGTRSITSPFTPAPVQDARAASTPPQARIAQLAHRAALLKDLYDIERLQRIYGYYIDKGQWDDAADLFATDGRLEVVGRGSWLGQQRVREYLHAIGPAGPAEGRLYDNMQLQPIVTVEPDRRTARGRWRLFAQYAQAGRFHEWGSGVYENEYVREHGVWKIRALRLYPTMFTPYEDGWGRKALKLSRMEPALEPDRPSTVAPGYEQAYVVPAHYADPADAGGARRRARAIASAAGNAPADATAQRAMVQEASRMVRELSDMAEIENMQTIYGYYLATLEWDALTELFTQDGTIEIALRGVYVGKPAVRRNLDLYGKQGLDHGVLHNHMQYQPVIHIAPDGRTAKLRSRAFSMMGNYGRNGTWMAGTYLNEFVKEGDVWRFRTDRQVNTYFAPYETGWKDLPLRQAPGITDSNPPDRPPTERFELYPRNHLPPYHYPNPVTGRPHTSPSR